MKEFSAVFLIVAVISGFAILIANITNENSCGEIGTAMEVPFRYTSATGCMIKPADKWIPLSSYRNVD